MDRYKKGDDDYRSYKGVAKATAKISKNDMKNIVASSIRTLLREEVLEVFRSDTLYQVMRAVFREYMQTDEFRNRLQSVMENTLYEDKKNIVRLLEDAAIEKRLTKQKKLPVSRTPKPRKIRF